MSCDEYNVTTRIWLEPKTHQSPHLNKLTDEKFMNGNINRHHWKVFLKANGKLREEFYSLFFKYEQLFFSRKVFPFVLADFLDWYEFYPHVVLVLTNYFRVSSAWRPSLCAVWLETISGLISLTNQPLKKWSRDGTNFPPLTSHMCQGVRQISMYFSMWCMSFNFNSVADPGFPRWEIGCNPLCFVRKPVILQDFCQKLHENEKIWPRGNL